MAQTRKSLMRSLGQFVGHIAKGITASNGSNGTTHEVRRSVEHEERDTPVGKVTLRRTIIEEISLPTISPSSPPPSTTNGRAEHMPDRENLP